MSRLAPAGAPRAGMLACICDPEFDVPANDNRWTRPRPWPLALGFAFGVLAQTLASGILPLAGAQLAPRPDLATLPFAALMLGAALASFPASFLGDAFGRRTGFALGASLGIAGGAILAFGILQRQFAFACLGALWLGMAQGFSFFYRHEAAASAGRPAAAAAGVMAGGLFAAVAGPSLAGLAETFFAPAFLVGSAVLAALAHTASLAVAVRLAPDARPWTQTGDAGPLTAILGPTLVAMLAWGGMSLVMAGAPLALMDCGIGEGALFGFIALHVAAMYGPAAPLALLGRRLPARLMAFGGLALVLAAIPLQFSTDPRFLAAALMLVGAGWSIATIGATGWLHQTARPGRLALALHDGALFSAAIVGAALAGRLF
ncbi:MFS transporter [Azorhizobium oxalatiphilum]|uniref:MFS transporter n=1 Tax=Azorhizobium oxalatiphilum TaxID=980631 RepID=A0A917CDI6_9HYPH|nr:hypothetical protein [Azorhizobium oxalatiphilum]GGF81038.1 MFS transporter [Azorhizobium oxalatiphilum]